jgi:TQXA domain-containing protein
VIIGTPAGGGPNLSLYCIDILANTYLGFGYELGTWDEANAPNVGFVARILDDYYPNTNEPSSLANLNQKAAAVQAAIWYFSDRYVLSTSDPLYPAVAAIVEAVQDAGPAVQPRRPASRLPRPL